MAQSDAPPSNDGNTPAQMRDRADRFRAIAQDFSAKDADIVRQYADDLDAKAAGLEQDDDGTTAGETQR